MKQTFYIDGITCMSCVAKLTEYYSAFKGVSEVAIDKESGSVSLKVVAALSPAALVEGLPENTVCGQSKKLPKLRLPLKRFQNTVNFFRCTS